MWRIIFGIILITTIEVSGLSIGFLGADGADDTMPLTQPWDTDYTLTACQYGTVPFYLNATWLFGKKCEISDLAMWRGGERRTPNAYAGGSREETVPSKGMEPSARGYEPRNIAPEGRLTLPFVKEPDSIHWLMHYRERGEYHWTLKQLDSTVHYMAEYIKLGDKLGHHYTEEDCSLVLDLFLALGKTNDAMAIERMPAFWELLEKWPQLCEKKQGGAFTLLIASYATRKCVVAEKLDIAARLLDRLKGYLSSSPNVSRDEQEDYLSLLESFANSLISSDSLRLIEPVYTERMVKSKEWMGTQSIEHASALNDLGWLYLKLNKHREALPLLEKACAIKQETIQVEDENMAVTLEHLAWAYTENDHYGKAEDAYRNALSIKSRLYGDTSLVYLSTLNELGWSLYRAGQTYEAVGILEGCLKGYQKATNDTSAYVRTITLLAGAYYKTGRSLEALLLLAPVYNSPSFKNDFNFRKEFLWIWQSLLQSGNADMERDYLLLIQELEQAKSPFRLLATLNDIGVMYKRWGKYSEAALWYEKSLSIIAELLGKEHTEYAITASNLAWALMLQHNYEAAKPYFLQCVEIREKLMPDSWLLAESYCNAGFLFFLMQAPDQSGELYAKGFDIFNRQLLHKFLYTSEDEKVELIQEIKDNLNGYLSLLNRYPNQIDPSLALDASIHLKSLALQNTRDLRQLIFENGDATYLSLLDSLSRIRVERGEGLIGAKEVAIGELGIEAEQIERELLKIEGYSELLSRYNLPLDSLRALLKEGEVLVDIIHFPIKSPDGCNCVDTIVYAALLMKNSWEQPSFVPLFKESQIKERFSDTIVRRDQYYVENIYQYSSSRGSGFDQKSDNANLYDLLWKPIESLVPDGATVWLSPSGLLHRLNVAGIQDSQKRFLGERYSFRQILSARSIADRDRFTPVDSIGSALIFGALNYNEGTTLGTDTAKLPLLTDNRGRDDFANMRPNIPEPWDTLRYARFEVNQLYRLFTNKGINTDRYSDEAGTEDQFYQVAKSQAPQIIHFSTHGFFFAQDQTYTGHTFQQAWHPLFRSGLVMADANKFWMNGKRSDGKHDGILTAYEVAQLYWPKLELVSLAACETGLGDINNSEGVVGLQRAFFKAGARHVIMSLWNVNDQATQQFMVRFYENWLIGQRNIHEAFRLTQQQIRDNFNRSPYYWAGFILVE